MQGRGEVTVAGSATSGPSVITAPPPQPGLKDHPVKNGEKEWEKSEVREDQSQTGSSGLGVICVVIIHSSCGHLPRTKPANHLLQSVKEILEISPLRTCEQLMSFEYGLQWIQHTLMDSSEFSSIWAAQIGLSSLLKTKGHKNWGLGGDGGSGRQQGEVRDELNPKILHNGGYVKFSKNF